MPNQPFYPNREGDQTAFFNNIQSKISSYFTLLDMSAARQAKIQLVLGWLTWTWQTYLPARRQDGPAATTWRNALATGTSGAATDCTPPPTAALTPPTGTPFYGMLTWLFEEIGRWKKAEGYTDTIGQDLGIIGAAATTHTAPPVLNAGAVGATSVELGFTLYEHTGLWIECQRQGDAGFTPLATDTASPYVDNRPLKTPGQPEWRDYRACWWDNDTPTLAFGQVLRVIIGGA